MTRRRIEILGAGCGLSGEVFGTGRILARRSMGPSLPR